jgi:cytoskeletal protein CcmA (bactofilin family)
VKCSSAMLGGRIEGNIEAEKKLDICKNGVLIGDIKAAILSIENGAYFAGNCEMKKIEKNGKANLGK